MLKLISVAAGVLTALTPAPKDAPKPKPQPIGGIVIVGVLPGGFQDVITGRDSQMPNVERDSQTPRDEKNYKIAPYEISPSTPDETNLSADERYDAMRAALNEKYARMFELKKQIDEHNSATIEMWEQYNALHNSYERALGKIIAAWVTEKTY